MTARTCVSVRPGEVVKMRLYGIGAEVATPNCLRLRYAGALGRVPIGSLCTSLFRMYLLERTSSILIHTMYPQILSLSCATLCLWQPTPNELSHANPQHGAIRFTGHSLSQWKDRNLSPKEGTYCKGYGWPDHWDSASSLEDIPVPPRKAKPGRTVGARRLVKGPHSYQHPQPMSKKRKAVRWEYDHTGAETQYEDPPRLHHQLKRQRQRQRREQSHIQNSFIGTEAAQIGIVPAAARSCVRALSTFWRISKSVSKAVWNRIPGSLDDSQKGGWANDVFASMDMPEFPDLETWVNKFYVEESGDAHKEIVGKVADELPTSKPRGLLEVKGPRRQHGRKDGGRNGAKIIQNHGRPVGVSPGRKLRELCWRSRNGGRRDLMSSLV